MKPERQLQVTADGSPTLHIPAMNVSYHSKHGAIQESMHVFLEAGLRFVLHKKNKEPIFVLEMGFGTGLNAWLTALEADKYNRTIHYTAIELYPLHQQEWSGVQFSTDEKETVLFQHIHDSSWNKEVALSDRFVLRKEEIDLLEFASTQKFDVVYFDAFAPSAQPQLWTKEVFEKLFGMMYKGGALVTYCAKGDVRRAMQAAGLAVEKLPGPKGKREMLRSVRE